MISELIDRVFPKTPDFFQLLYLQCKQVSLTTDNLVLFMDTGDVKAGKMLKNDEHEADKIRMQSLHQLNQAFSTPMDREDIYRAIAALDRIVTYAKSTYHEMKVLDVQANDASRSMALELQKGVKALEEGFRLLPTDPVQAVEYAAKARHTERRAEKKYRLALGELFQGDDYLYMFKHRELYRHLSNAMDRVHATANVLQDIIVKIN
jgi:uncharacterized protein Yka (UPF0111/DUF47 family)